jgi:hypothetical protein
MVLGLGNRTICKHDASRGICRFNNKSLNIDYLEDKTEINVYPNPTNEKISIKANDEISKIEIYNSTGQFCRFIEYEKPLDKLQIDMSNLEVGVYIMILYKKDKKILKKIIKE